MKKEHYDGSVTRFIKDCHEDWIKSDTLMNFPTFLGTRMIKSYCIDIPSVNKPMTVDSNYTLGQ